MEIGLNYRLVSMFLGTALALATAVLLFLPVMQVIQSGTLHRRNRQDGHLHTLLDHNAAKHLAYNRPRRQVSTAFTP